MDHRQILKIIMNLRGHLGSGGRLYDKRGCSSRVWYVILTIIDYDLKDKTITIILKCYITHIILCYIMFLGFDNFFFFFLMYLSKKKPIIGHLLWPPSSVCIERVSNVPRLCFGFYKD